MSLISAVIIEDKTPVAKSLETLLNMRSDIQVVGIAANVNEGAKLISDKNPNLVFSDIQLSSTETGFDLIERFPNANFKLIFVTAFNDYAIKAFKYNAIDYLLKPVDPDELEEAIGRAVLQLSNNDSQVQLSSLLNMMNNTKSAPKKILFKTIDQVRAVDIQEIVRFESDNNYTSVHLVGDKKLVVSKPIKDYSEILEDRNFFRPHQSHLINLNCFELYLEFSYEKQDGGYIKLKDGTSIPVSKRKKNLLFELLENL
ncbi:MAG: LytTR family DNA-binding domain-containing protein [Flavobacteriales bacterium]|nr:LytTR family DNA-binding domain-containing protein [Flavobacteriales bacterium]